jgi:hypothetical protein
MIGVTGTSRRIMFASFRPLAWLSAAVLCMTLAVPVAAAGPPTVLVVFPFRVADGIDPANGSLYATAIANAVAAAGDGVKVIVAPVTAPADYLHTTAADGGEYYLSGFIAPPISGTAAVLEQLVSKRSGTTVWGNTAQISQLSEVAGQGPVVRTALIAYTQRGYYTIVNATPSPAPTHAEKPKQKNGIQTADTGPAPRKPLDLPPEAYGFSSAPTAPPKVYATTDHPTRFAVLAVTGNLVPPVIRTYTETSLIASLTHHGQSAAQGDPATTSHSLLHPADTCKLTGSKYLLFGQIATQSTDATDGTDQWTNAHLTLIVWDCANAVYIRPQPFVASAFSWKTAVDRATLKSATDYLSKLGSSTSRAS